jgi:hypothetical protein
MSADSDSGMRVRRHWMRLTLQDVSHERT